MTVTLGQLRTDVARRLGDSAFTIWSASEIDGYITEGYDDLTQQSGCLWATDCFPDYAAAFTFTAEFERAYAEANNGDYVNGPANFTAAFERDFADNGNGPANHNQHWEYDSGYVAVTEVSALVDLPDTLQEIERATWNTKRIDALRSRDFEPDDSRYELAKGPVDAYTQDKDGLRRLRKWRVPAVAYVPYSFDSSSDDGFGIIRDVGDIVSSLTVDGDYGDLVHIDGVECFSDFGIIGPVYKDTNSLRLEYRRRGADLSAFQDFEIQDRYTVYIRHYALAQAFAREGDGQDLKLSEHFMGRYHAGLARAQQRQRQLAYSQAKVIGGQGPRPWKQPRPNWPSQYGTVVR